MTVSYLQAEIGRTSRGGVSAISPSGPVLARQPDRTRKLRPDTFVPALARADRITVAALTAGWAACLVAFWVWWLTPAHRLTTFGLVINSLIMLYISGFPAFFVMSANRLRRVNPDLPVAPFRVAFVVTRAPSEPWDVVRDTLSAMLGQAYDHPYDVWLCDEQPTGEIRAWCARQQVRISSRYGIDGYHRPYWPRRTRCKEGNLAYFYDRVGFRGYDIVAQLDCDHVPSPTYLAEMVRPFADPAIGYVAAPSVCDANAASSWSARGRLHREASFHGPFQLGHSGGFGPLCIGSHYAVRTAALRQIGGIGPELAEDFSTTFLLNGAGWQGAFAIDAEAHGDGPSSFPAMVVQEFQWSRSLTVILLALVPRNLGRLSWHMRARFVYALSYYILLAATTVVGLALAPVAAITGHAWMSVNYLAFLAHLWSVAVWLVLMAALLRNRRQFRPPDAPLVSWEGFLYGLARWPFVTLGVLAAVWQVIRRRPVTFLVTPKRPRDLELLPSKLVVPFIAMSIACAAAGLIGEARHGPAGYIFLSLLQAATYAAVACLLAVMHARETAANTGVARARAFRATAGRPLALGLTAVGVAAPAIALYPAYVMTVLRL